MGAPGMTRKTLKVVGIILLIVSMLMLGINIGKQKGYKQGIDYIMDTWLSQAGLSHRRNF